MTKIKITVTANDIEFGRRHSASKCPIALACNRAFPGRTAQVYGDIKIYGGMKVGKYYLSLEAYEFIDAFDIGETVEPFSFEAEPFETENM